MKKKPGLITGKEGQESNYRDCLTKLRQKPYLTKYG